MRNLQSRKRNKSAPSPNSLRLRGGADKTEAVGRPGEGRWYDQEPRHNYLSKPFIDGGRWREMEGEDLAGDSSS